MDSSTSYQNAEAWAAKFAACPEVALAAARVGWEPARNALGEPPSGALLQAELWAGLPLEAQLLVARFVALACAKVVPIPATANTLSSWAASLELDSGEAEAEVLWREKERLEARLESGNLRECEFEFAEECICIAESTLDLLGGDLRWEYFAESLDLLPQPSIALEALASATLEADSWTAPEVTEGPKGEEADEEAADLPVPTGLLAADALAMAEALASRPDRSVLLEHVERFPSIAWGNPGPVVHYLEAASISRDEIEGSLSRRPTVTAIALVKREARVSWEANEWARHVLESLAPTDRRVGEALEDALETL